MSLTGHYCQIDINNLVETNLELLKRMNSINSKCENVENYVSEMNSSNLFSSLISSNVYNLCTLSPCGAGRTMLGFDIDGSFYSCDYFVGIPEFKIGNIFEVENVKQIVYKSILSQGLLNRNVNSIKECSVCKWKSICTYHCAADSYFNHHSIYKPNYMCEYVKKIIPRIIDILYRGEINPVNIKPC